MKTGNIRINEYGRVAFSNGAEIPPAFSQGGMKSVYDAVFPVKSLQSRDLLRLYDHQIST
jgi:hypothetical protein